MEKRLVVVDLYNDALLMIARATVNPVSDGDDSLIDYGSQILEQGLAKSG
jgi:hypothetical protein